jgi:hypothetical protein
MHGYKAHFGTVYPDIVVRNGEEQKIRLVKDRRTRSTKSVIAALFSLLPLPVSCAAKKADSQKIRIAGIKPGNRRFFTLVP